MFLSAEPPEELAPGWRPVESTHGEQAVLEEVAHKITRLKSTAVQVRADMSETRGQSVAPIADLNSTLPLSTASQEPVKPTKSVEVTRQVEALHPSEPAAPATVHENPETDLRTRSVPAVRDSEPVRMPSAPAVESRRYSTGTFGELGEDGFQDHEGHDSTLDPPKHERLRGGPTPHAVESVTPTTARSTNLATSFESSFLGDMDDDDDDDDDDDEMDGDFSSAVSRRRSIPLVPVGLGVSVVVIIGLYMFRASIFATGPTPETAPIEIAEGVREGSLAAPQKNETKAAPQVKSLPTTAQIPAETPVMTASTPQAGPLAKPQEVAARSPADIKAFTTALDAAKRAYQRNKLSRAKSEVEAALILSPMHPDGLVILAQVQLEQADMNAAIETARSCVQVAPHQADCWLTIGVIEQEHKRFPAAVTAYQNYLDHAAPKSRYISHAKSELRKLRKKIG